LNKGENLRALRRDLFYASEGAIRHHNPEQQTEQASGLEQQWNGQWR
jgi:TnpA family transposase